MIGGGGAAETFVAELDGSGLSVVVFEEFRVGGECPFVACMPTKAMLHDAATGRAWTEAVRRRRDVVEDLEDDGHATELRAHGPELVRERAAVSGPTEVVAAGERYRVGHIVLATGSEPLLPPIDGLDSIGDRLWTSADAMTVDERPTRLTILGGGVIGCEMATIFSGFGTEVHLLDTEPRAFPALPPEIGEIADQALRARGVRVHRGSEVVQVEPRGSGVRVRLADGPCLDTDRLLVATGTRPRTSGIGLDAIGLADGSTLTVADDGRVDAVGSIWAMGDVAGRGEYTHLANHQARVVAGAISGRGDRRFDDVVVPACVFTDPPIVTIGPTPDRCGDDIVWVTARLSEVARFTTDDLVDGVLHVGVERPSGELRAAHGIGAGFDILATALVTAIDSRVPVHRLARSMAPFPTVGEMLPLIYSRASASVGVD